MEIERLLGQLANIHPQMVRKIWSKGNPYEQICGFISYEITTWLIKQDPSLKTAIRDVNGTYWGEGTEYSGTKETGTGHCWVEVRIPAGKIIIDGAYAQFFPPTIPPEVRDRIRLAIFYPGDKRQEWYK